MASVYDVAELAGLSVATVSRVLSGAAYPVRPETRDRVLAAADQLDFRPNLLARALVTAQTRTIGTIVHDVADPYFAEIVRGLEDRAREAGYQLFVCSSDRDPGRELAYVETLLAYRIDGLVFVGGGLEDPAYERELGRLVRSFRAQGGAVVVLAPHTVDAPSVVPDNKGGAAAMARHLVALGHRRIAFITGPTLVKTSRIRFEGYREGLRAAGVDFDPELVAEGHFTIGGGAEATSWLLDRSPDLTAIFAANDVMAVGALQALDDRGFSVPDDVSVAGFDDIRMAAHLSVPLTTVHVPMYELGRTGGDTALGILAGKRPRSRVLATDIVERRSTAVALRPQRPPDQEET